MNAPGVRISRPLITTAVPVQGAVYAAAVAGALLLILHALGVAFSLPYQVMAMVAAMLSFVAFREFDLTAPWHVGRAGSIGTRVMYAWATVVGTLLFIAYTLKISAYFSRAVLLLWIFGTPLVLLTVNGAVRALLLRYLPHLAMRRSTVIVFASDSARLLVDNLQRSGTYHVLGYFEERPATRTSKLDDLPLLGRVGDVATYVRERGIQVVFVVLPEDGASQAVPVLEALGDTTASVYCVPDFLTFNLMGAEMSEVEGIPVLQVAETPFYGVDGVMKHLFDAAFAVVALIAAAPVMLLIALAIKLDSPGPVIYAQQRYGLNGRPFRVYKFRSMTVADRDAEIVQVSRFDPRVTRVGRFLRRTSLDELPQFWNVLRGEMSVVGPRPHSVVHNEHYRRAVRRYMVRHKVKPGLTGWAQIHGLRGETAETGRMEERIRYDLDYIRNWSPWLDLKIILMTVFMVLRDRNAY